MRHLSRLLPGALVLALILSPGSVTATASVRGDSHGDSGSSGSDDGKDGKDKANAPAPSPSAPAASAAPPSAPGQGNATPATGATPSGQVATKSGATPATSATPGKDGAPATPADRAAPPTPVAPAAPPVIGESMGLKPVAGTVRVRLPASTGYVSLASAGSVPSGAVVDARAGTVVLRSAVDADGRTQSATIRGAVFEVRQSATGKGMTDLVLRGGRPQGCPSTGTAALARAAMVHGLTSAAKAGSGGGLWAQDRHGRFRSRGRNSVATVRGTRWVTRETCAGTLTRVMDGAVDVFDLRKHRTVRVRAGHSYLARTAG